MDAIVSQIQTLAGKADSVGRANIQSALRQALRELESPQDTLYQIYTEHLRYALVRVGIRSGLFQSLSRSEGSLSAAQLAKETGGSVELFERIARFFASNDMIDEAGHGQFKANTTTHMLAAPMTSGLASYMFDVICPAIQALPEFLAETGYADVTDGTKTSFQKAFHTDLTHFAWLGQRPEYLASWQQTQTALGSSEWLTGFELFEKEALGTEDDVERVFFVDVGGGHGHQCLAVRDKYPGFKGQFVLEELPEVVQQLSEIPGLRIEVNDIFEEQKIKGAKYYYLRHILHAWNDARCVQILQNLKSAMAHDSRILVDEILLPETNVPYLGAAADLTMMIMQGSKERTRKQWTMLAERSGLRIAHVHEYNDSIGLQAIIVFELDQV